MEAPEPVVAAGLAAGFEPFFTGFFECFLVEVVVVAVVEAELALFAGGLAGVCAANINGMEATANAIASKLFFISFFSLAGSLPAYNSMLRQIGWKLDSLRRLQRVPNSGQRALRFISEGVPAGRRAILIAQCSHGKSLIGTSSRY